jgi:hypothetical protein
MEASVKHLTMMVTPDGDWVLPDSEAFFKALGDPDPDYDSIGFAVKNLGFIKFQVYGKSIIEVELHPRNVELPALLAAQQQLVTSQVTLFRLRYFDTTWHSEISSTAEHMVARLSELCTPAFVPPPTERFVVEHKDVSVLFEDDQHWLRPLAQKWRISFGQFDPGVISLAVTHQLLSRLMIIGVRQRDQDPVWRFIGEGHQWIGGQYRLQGVGERVENMPDKDYGEWVTEFYKSVARAGQPRYDLINGTIRYEDETGRPERVIRYERLLLPWKTPSDEVFVTMCSKVVA